jgi:hypothetical protein
VDELGQVTASATELSQSSKLAQTSQVLNGASTVTDGMALTDSTYGLAKNWDKLSPEQRLFAIGQIGFWSGMTAHSAHQAMGGSKSPYGSGDVEQFMHDVGAKPKESMTGDVPQGIPKETVTTTQPVVTQSKSTEPMKVVERVQGAVREGFTLSDADAQALGAMNGEGSHPIELSPQLKQQLGIYSKKVTTEDVQRRLGAIEKKNQPQETEPKTETVQPTSQGTQPEPQVKSPELVQREQELSQALPKRQQVPIEIDSSLEGNAVRVHYAVDKKGQITDIQIKAGEQATTKDIQLHASTVKRMQQYSGLSRHVQRMKDHINGWVNQHGVPPVGSKAWEAQLEIDKLPKIIQERAERLAGLTKRVSCG